LGYKDGLIKGDLVSRTILVTGGAGFIGSNFLHYMVKKYPHYKFINYDKLTYAGNLANVRDLEDSSGYEFVHGDICDSEKLDQFRVDAVVNFAAESHVDRSISSAQEFIVSNILGTEVLLEFCKKRSVSRFIQISTDEVYGSQEEVSFNEKDDLHPSSPYSASKAGADLLAISHFNTYGTPVIVTRSANNYGPYQYPEKLIPFFIAKALNDEPLPLYGDGKNVRDWLYVEDNCAAIDEVLHKGIVGQIYNIGGGNELANIDIAELILEQLGKDKSLISYVADRLGHDRRYSISSEKVKKLGWFPTHNFKQAIAETVSWYKDNRDWWQPLLDKGSNLQS